MDLYHVSTQLYEAGKTYGPYPLNHFAIQRRTDSYHVKLEADFEAARPKMAVSRKTAIFAFDSIEACLSFWEGERDHGSRREDYSGFGYFYRVTMPNPTRAPFQLSGHAFFLLQLDLPDEPVIAEYWHPEQKWRCWEYLDSTLTVVERVTPENFLVRGAFNCIYMEDKRLSQRLWPIQALSI